MTSYPVTRHKHFRVISPITVLRCEERLAPDGHGRSGASTPVADHLELRKDIGLQSEDEVKKLRAQLEYEKVKIQRVEREKTQLSRELEEKQADREREMSQMSREIRRLTAKLEEEHKKNDELMSMLVTERLKHESEMSSSVVPQLSPTDVKWKEELDAQLKRTERKCKELEDAVKSLEKNSSQSARTGGNGYVQPLVRAAACGDLETLRSNLVSSDQTVTPSTAASIAEMDGTTGLHAACETGNSGCLQVLLEDGGNPNAVRPRDKVVPLHLAAANGHKSCIEVLLEHKVDVNVIDKQGYTALCHALGKGNHKCVQLLLGHGAHLQGTTKTGQSALHVAAAGGCHDCLHHLLNYAENQGLTNQLVNCTDRDGWTAVHLASRKGHASCLSLLLGCTTVSLSVQDNWGRTPLDIAATTECKDMIKRSVESQTLTVHVMGRHNSPVGIVCVYPHSQWQDIDQSVGAVLTEYSRFLNGGTAVPDLVVETPSCMPNITLDEVDSGVRKLLHQSPRSKQHERKTSRDSDSGLGERRTGSGSTVSSGSLPNPPAGQGSPVSVDSPFADMADAGGQTNDEFRLSLDSVKQFEVGRLIWAVGDTPSISSSHTAQAGLSGMLPPFLAFKETPLQLTVHLKDPLHEGQLDQTANDLLIPVATLQTYLHLLEDSKAVVLCGPAGTGKSYLAQQLAVTLNDKLSHRGVSAGEITHVVLGNGFTRSNLLYFMHSKGFLVPTGRQGDGDAREASVSTRKTPSIIIMDNLERVSVCEVFAEILTALNYRGSKNSLWLNCVSHTAANGETETFPEGRYYLKHPAYFITTMDKHGATDMDVSIHRCFRWIACRFDAEPVKSLLQRDLRRQLLGICHGTIPSSGDERFRWTEWVWRVWYRLNICAALLQLPELLLGVKLFASCPVEKNDGNAVIRWFCDLWNFGVAPCVQDVVLRNGGSPRIVAGHCVMSSSVLLTMIYKAIIPECPLEQTELRRFAESLVGYSEGHQLLQGLREQVKDEPSHVSRSPREHRKIPSPRVARRMASLPEGQEGFLHDEHVVTSTPVRENHQQVQGKDTRNGSPSLAFRAREGRRSPLIEDGVKSNGLPSPPSTETVRASSESPKEEHAAREVKRSSSRAGDFARRLFGRLKPKGSKTKAPRVDRGRESTKSSVDSLQPSIVEPEKQSREEKQWQRPAAVEAALRAQREQDERQDDPETSHKRESRLRPPQVQSSKTKKADTSASPSPSSSDPRYAGISRDQLNGQNSPPSQKDRNFQRPRRSGSFRLKSSSGEIGTPPVRPRANSDVGLFTRPLGLRPRQVKETRAEGEFQATSTESRSSQDPSLNKVVTVADVHVGISTSRPVQGKRDKSSEKTRSRSHILQQDGSSPLSPVRREMADAKERSRTVSLLGSGAGRSAGQKTAGRIARTSQV